jgi:S1-C subfamily serine protease
MRAVLLALLVLTAMLLDSRVSALDLPDLAERAKPSVVLLTVYDESGTAAGSGTGFFISEDGRVVTNDHVVEDATRVTATLADGRELEVRGVLANDAGKDIAILQVSGDKLPKPLPLGGTKNVRVGDEIVVLGSPQGLSTTLSTGIVSAIRQEGLDGGIDGQRTARAWAIQITAAISPGSSGSPVMTRNGDVIAVAVGLMQGGGSLNFAVPIEDVKSLLSSVGPLRPFQGGGSGISRNLIISAAFFGGIVAAVVVGSWLRKRRTPPKRGHRSSK